MNSKRYLIKLQFLGFRFHGVQKQVGYLSIHDMVELCLQKEKDLGLFRLRFASRTDARVSAIETFCLIMFDEATSPNLLEDALENYLPADIKCLNVVAVRDDFTIIKASQFKEYHYYFSFGKDKNHPFCAPYLTQIVEDLDVDLMKKAAELFRGKHNFINYCYRPKNDLPKTREIIESEITSNTLMTASFFPKQSYVFKVRSSSFMRGQVRLMMGALFRVGQGDLTLADLKSSLETLDRTFVKWQAPASGLILYRTQLH